MSGGVTSGRRKGLLADLAFLGVLALVSVVAWRARDGGLGFFPYLSSDAGSICTFCAAHDHPDLFARDALLGNLRNFAYYATVHVPVVRLLERLTHDYGRAYVLLLPFHLFVQGAGFYWLGRVVMRSRAWAALLAAVTLAYVPLNLAEMWGACPDALPRISFQAVLPYLLVLALRVADAPALWAPLLALAGCLAWVHPVSTPAWGLALACGLAAVRPQGVPVGRHLATLVLAGCAFLAAFAPFAIHYAWYRDTSAADPAQVREALAFRFQQGLIDVPAELVELAVRLTKLGLLPVGLAGAVAVSLLAPNRREVRAAAGWVVGLFAAGALLPLADWAHSRLAGTPPAELDLVRSLRYLVPVLEVAATWGLCEVARAFDSRSRTARVAVTVGCFALPAAFAAWHWPRGLEAGLRPLGTTVAEPDPSWSAALRALREQTRPGMTVVTVGIAEPAAVRYEALRPMAWAFKDGSSFAYMSRRKLVGWYGPARRETEIAGGPPGAARLRAAVAFARDVGADVLLVREKADAATLSESGAELVLASGPYSVVRVGGGPAP